MTEITCMVIECEYNKQGICTTDEITVSECGDCMTFEFAEEFPKEGREDEADC